MKCHNCNARLANIVGSPETPRKWCSEKCRVALERARKERASKLYKITLHGCDDYTTVTMQLTPEEAALLDKVSYKVNRKSDNGCMPTMEVKEKK